MKNPFYILNVTPASSPEEIKKAYHNLAKLYHPDVFAGDKETAQEKMKELNWAYESLQDRALFIQFSNAYYQNEKQESEQQTKNDTKESAPKSKQNGNIGLWKRYKKHAIICLIISAVLAFITIPAVNNSRDNDDNSKYSYYDQDPQYDSGNSIKSNVTVYITDTGTKYHRVTCGSLYRSQHAISLSEAVKDGYKPCERCNPPTH